MSIDLLLRLASLISVSFIGYVAARGGAFGARQASQVLSGAAFNVLGPALLFRTTVKMPIDAQPWHALLAYFVPALLWMWLVRWFTARRAPTDAAAPTTAAMTATFGNSVQVGIPLAATFFEAAGLQIHLALVSIHALVLLCAATVLVEMDRARSQRGAGERVALMPLLAGMVRATLVHPVVLPVLVGFAWNLLGLPLPALLDQVLAMMAQGFVPLCLLLIGVTLVESDLRGAVGTALWFSLAKLVGMPLLVGAVAWFGFELRGTVLAVVVMATALPVGNNAVLFAQRYRTLVPESTGAVMLSTILYAVTAPLWLAALSLLPR